MKKNIGIDIIKDLSSKYNQNFIDHNKESATSVMMMMMNCFCGMVDRRKALALFPAGTIVRDPHHLESPTRREQDFNLRRT